MRTSIGFGQPHAGNLKLTLELVQHAAYGCLIVEAFGMGIVGSECSPVMLVEI